MVVSDLFMFKLYVIGRIAITEKSSLASFFFLFWMLQQSVKVWVPRPLILVIRVKSDVIPNQEGKQMAHSDVSYKTT